MPDFDAAKQWDVVRHGAASPGPPDGGRRRPLAGRLLAGIVIGLVLIGLAAVVGRARDLHFRFQTGIPPPTGSFDEGFYRHPVLTLVHIFPGFIFLTLGPLQFWTRLRVRWIRLHRWTGRAYLVCGLIVGLTALIMGFAIGFGGANQTTANTVFGGIFLFCLVRAYQCVRNGKIALHREWMIRGFAIGLAIASMRPLVGLFLVFSNLQAQEILGIVFWLAFTIHLLTAEVWINHTRMPGA
ncbi:MAG TPA: DUF2306 domain-containing protein [Acidobacteriota bacterium]|nr:DUF2306 domain-containing protein [Acidobacteriota bacterium]